MFCHSQTKKLRLLINEKNNSGYNIKFWWRDDDISESTKELKRLLDFSINNKLFVHLSVIPKYLSKNAINLIKKYNNVLVLQHGYEHKNNADFGEPLNEFSCNRPLSNHINNINLGFTDLSFNFGKQFIPIFVPPWHHISETVIEQLSELGIRGISLIGDYNKKYNNLRNNNVHIDIHRWDSKTENNYQVKIRSYNEIIAEIYNIIFKIDDQQILIGILTHSQIMNINHWRIFRKVIRNLKKMDIEFIKNDLNITS